LKSFIPEVIEAGRGADSVAIVEQFNSNGSGNNPADLRQSEPELGHEFLRIDVRRCHHELVFFTRVRRLQRGNLAHPGNALEVNLDPHGARSRNVSKVRNEAVGYVYR
jgi:hypothetical protein